MTVNDTEIQAFPVENPIFVFEKDCISPSLTVILLSQRYDRLKFGLQFQTVVQRPCRSLAPVVPGNGDSCLEYCRCSCPFVFAGSVGAVGIEQVARPDGIFRGNHAAFFNEVFQPVVVIAVFVNGACKARLSQGGKFVFRYGKNDSRRNACRVRS